MLASPLPEIALQMRELGFDKLIGNLPKEDFAEVEKRMGSVRSAVATDGCA